LSEPFEGQRSGLFFNGSSLAVSLGVAAVTFPHAVTFVALLPFALGTLGLYHYVRARSSNDISATAHHLQLCTHFGLLAISIVGALVSIFLVAVFLFFKD
jgi:hypothetical protein